MLVELLELVQIIGPFMHHAAALVHFVAVRTVEDTNKNTNFVLVCL